MSSVDEGFIEASCDALEDCSELSSTSSLVVLSCCSLSSVDEDEGCCIILRLVTSLPPLLSLDSFDRNVLAGVLEEDFPVSGIVIDDRPVILDPRYVSTLLKYSLGLLINKNLGMKITRIVMVVPTRIPALMIVIGILPQPLH